MGGAKKQKLLVIAPHPDDEVLGCGGLIKKVKDDGGKVYILFMTIGDTHEYSVAGISSALQRMAEVEKVAKFLGYDDYRIAFPGEQYFLRLDSIPQKELITEIERGGNVSLNAIKPTIVAIPCLNDYHQDHRNTTQAFFAAARPLPDSLKPFQSTIIGYECVSTADWWTQPRQTNLFVGLTQSQVTAKLEALELYSSQLRPANHPRSLNALRNLAAYRGMQIGEDAAEAFFCYRHVL